MDSESYINPKVLAFSNNRIFITWSQTTSNEYGIGALIVDFSLTNTITNGKTTLAGVVPEWLVVRGYRTAPGKITLVKYDADEVLLLWTVSSQATDIHGVYMAQYDEQGILKMAPQKYSTFDYPDQINPNLLMLSGDKCLLTWEVVKGIGYASQVSFGRIMTKTQISNTIPDINIIPSFSAKKGKVFSTILTNIASDWDDDTINYWVVMPPSTDHSFDYTPSTNTFTATFNNEGVYHPRIIAYDKYLSQANTIVDLNVSGKLLCFSYVFSLIMLVVFIL